MAVEERDHRMAVTNYPTSDLAYEVEREVRSRYARAAERVEAGLCCSNSSFDDRYLEALPKEIIEKDYGCGDTTACVGTGETVVDLGSGAGKACYILAQKVGPKGRIIGVDFNEPMLALARKYQRPIAEKLGYANTCFVKGRIQDLALDLEKLEAWLRRNPVDSAERLFELESECQRLRREEPLIADNSVDIVVSNCVLNLVRQDQKKQLFAEILRVLKPGGRAVISDITCDEDPTPAILNDPVLWSGCIAGAFREDRFPEMFAEAGFCGVEILSRQQEPWQVIDGIEFRSMTVRAFKGKEGPCLERNQAVVYKGPWRTVRDDDDHTYHRGKRTAVCDKTFRLLTNPNGPYAAHVDPVPPREEIALDDAEPFDCDRAEPRHPHETKGQEYKATKLAGGSRCNGASACC
ncbi:MAG: methyltransferase domain-containing protein [Phycisphaerae bacterium]